jgi:hypothetical protein
MKKLLFLIPLIIVFLITITFQRYAFAVKALNQPSGDKKNQVAAATNSSQISDTTASPITDLVNSSAGNEVIEFIDEDVVNSQSDLKQFDLKSSDIKENTGNSAADVNSSSPYILDNLGVNANFGGRKSWVIKNSRSAPGRLLINLQDLINLENGCANDQERAVDPGCDNPKKEGDLGKIINLKIAWDGVDKVASTLNTSEQAKIEKDWAALPSVILQPKEQGTLTAYWAVGENSYGNEIQGDSVEFKINFQLTGAKSESLAQGVSTDPQEAVAASSSLDSDNDGLTDYEEKQIYKTDPFNPDTDGDGYSDGREVKNGYDPNNPLPVKKVYPNP